MPNIVFDDIFIKNYKKRVLKSAKLHHAYQKAMHVFAQNPHHPSLKNHKLKGKQKHFYAFYIAPDYRVIYAFEENTYYFLDVGKHEEVYN